MQTHKQEVSSRVDETNQSIAASHSQWEDFHDTILWPLISSLPTLFRLWQLYQGADGGFTFIWPGCFVEELITRLAVESLRGSDFSVKLQNPVTSCISFFFLHFLFDSRPFQASWFWTLNLKLPEVLSVGARQGGRVKLELQFDV